LNAPKHLSAKAKALFGYISETFTLEAHDYLRLVTACETWDRGQEARRRIAKDGAYVLDRFDQLRAHPAVAVERDARVGFLRALREMGLDVLEDSSETVRPPRVTAKR
jgi:P27 family predicted phage terminase small subunit